MIPVGRISMVASPSALLAIGLVALGAVQLLAQAPPGGRIIDREPFDRMTLDQANENKVLLIHPVKLPDRRVPEKPKLSEKLRVRLLADNQEYEVTWQNIAKLELFEEMALAEANQLAADGKFDEAYEYFVFLMEYYPKVQGLAAAQQSYLYLSSAAAFRQQKYDEALALAEELLSQNRDYRASESSPTMLAVLGNIADKLIGQYVEKQDFRSARTLLGRLSTTYRATDEPFAVRWRDEMVGRASARRDEARAHLEAGRFVEAYDATAAMRSIWPEVEGGPELAAEIARRFPRVVVGVDHAALVPDSRSLLDPAARRVGRLLDRGLLEFVGPGPEGGSYVSPLGTVEQSVDGLELLFNLRPDAGVTGHELSSLLLGWARPGHVGFEPAWARTLATVRVSNVSRVTAQLKSPHVLAKALLQGSYERVPDVGQTGVRGTGPFYVFSRDESLTRLAASDRPGVERVALAEVAERHYADPTRAILALKRGEIGVLDRVYPGDIPALKNDPELALGTLTMPTSHVLLVREKHPFLANRTFRRALVYGLNRELLLNQGLLKGQKLPGFRVISAPFPAPTDSNESQAYAYDQQIAPRPYDPRLALTLRLVAAREVKTAYEKLLQKPPELTPILIGHPADETSRIACRAIVKQWDLIGVKAKLAEFPPGQFDDQGACDLIYVQAAAWEPLVDANRLLGPEGAAPIANSFIQLTLRQIEQATNWQQARERFRHLHRLLHEDVSLIPLYQTLDHYAYRRSLQGLASPRVTLYQNIAQWQVDANLASATSRTEGSGSSEITAREATP
jgi:hypothetical protein